MSIRRNLVRIGSATAMAVPMFVVAALLAPTTMSGAASSPAYPMLCQLTGSLTFSPALSSTPTKTTSGGPYEVTVVSGTLSDCLYAGGNPAPSGGTFLISLETTFKTSHPATYWIGDCAAFSSILEYIKHSVITVTWTGDPDDGGTTTVIPRSVSINKNQVGETQFSLIGNKTSTSGEYAESAFVQITLSLDAQSTSALSNDCSGGVSSANLDPSTSVAAL